MRRAALEPGRRFGGGQHVEDRFFHDFGFSFKYRVQVMMRHHLQIVERLAVIGEVVAGGKGQKDVATAVVADAAGA